MLTVELLGDEELDRAVRAAWRRLDQAGFPSLARHRHPTNRPHLTLASTDQWPPAAAAAIAGALRVLPVLVRLEELRFTGIGCLREAPEICQRLGMPAAG